MLTIGIPLSSVFFPHQLLKTLDAG